MIIVSENNVYHEVRQLCCCDKHNFGGYDFWWILRTQGLCRFYPDQLYTHSKYLTDFFVLIMSTSLVFDGSYIRVGGTAVDNWSDGRLKTVGNTEQDIGNVTASKKRLQTNTSQFLGPHSGDEYSSLLAYDTVSLGKYYRMFQNGLLPPSSGPVQSKTCKQFSTCCSSLLSPALLSVHSSTTI